MNVALVDIDLIHNPKAFVPSLDLMKYSSYFKLKGNYVKMLYSDEVDFQQYDTIILSQDLHNNSQIPTKLLLDNRVIFCGRNFGGARRLVLPDEVERRVADRSIYEPFFKVNREAFPIGTKIFYRKIMGDFDLIRFSHNGKFLFPVDDYDSNYHAVLCYDEEIGKNESFLEVSQKLKSLNKRLSFVFTQRIPNWNYFYELVHNGCDLELFSDRPLVVLESDVSDEIFYENYNLFRVSLCWGFPYKNENETWDEYGRRELIDRIQKYFWCIARGKRLRMTPAKFDYENSQYVKLLWHFCAYTRIAGKTSDLSFKTFLPKRGAGTAAIGNKLIENDSELDYYFSLNNRRTLGLGDLSC